VNGLLIRRLDVGDAAIYRQIRLAALKAAPEAFGSTFEAEAARPIAAAEERLATSCVFGALDTVGIRGMAGFKREEGAKDCHKGFVWGLFVAPHARRAGVAQALMAAIMDEASGVVEQLTLTVTTTNTAAIGLYKSLGFQTYGVEPRALKSAAGYSDEMLMIRFLQTHSDN
jgi:ribosomal protein S18 acetylase RimI-like enzyme